MLFVSWEDFMPLIQGQKEFSVISPKSLSVGGYNTILEASKKLKSFKADLKEPILPLFISLSES